MLKIMLLNFSFKNPAGILYFYNSVWKGIDTCISDYLSFRIMHSILLGTIDLSSNLNQVTCLALLQVNLNCYKAQTFTQPIRCKFLWSYHQLMASMGTDLGWQFSLSSQSTDIWQMSVRHKTYVLGSHWEWRHHYTAFRKTTILLLSQVILLSIIYMAAGTMKAPQAFYMKCFADILNIRWCQQSTDVDILSVTSLSSPAKYIAQWYITLLIDDIPACQALRCQETTSIGNSIPSWLCKRSLSYWCHHRKIKMTMRNINRG